MLHVTTEIKEWFGLFCLVLFIVFAGFFIFSGGKNKEAQDEFYHTIRVSQEAVEDVLKDPDSAKFEFLNENCGTVNSKNSFGGYVGSRRFVSINNIVDLEGHSVSKKEMDALWRKHCN